MIQVDIQIQNEQQRKKCLKINCFDDLGEERKLTQIQTIKDILMICVGIIKRQTKKTKEKKINRKENKEKKRNRQETKKQKRKQR